MTKTTKKDKKLEEKEETAKFLTAAQYWEWRTTLEEMKVRKLHLEVLGLKRDLMEKEIENRKMKLTSLKRSINQHAVNGQQEREQYEEFLKRLEKEVGTSVKGKVIDEITFEIRDLD